MVAASPYRNHESNRDGCAPVEIPSSTPYSAIAVWALVTSVSVAIVTAIVIAPVAQTFGYSSLAGFIYQTFSYVCHQISQRSFHFAGYKFAVCSRCTGLYSGLMMAALIYPLTRSLKRTDTPRVVWLILAAIPIVIDFALTYFGLWQNNHFTRFITGALLGSVAVFYIVPGLIELTSSVQAYLSRKR